MGFYLEKDGEPWSFLSQEVAYSAAFHKCMAKHLSRGDMGALGSLEEHLNLGHQQSFLEKAGLAQPWPTGRVLGVKSMDKGNVI